MVNITSGNPFYLDILLTKIAGQNTPVNFGNFAHLLADILNNNDSAIFQIMHNKISGILNKTKNKDIFNSLMLKLASSPKRKQELALLMRQDNKKIQMALNKLAEEQIIAKEGDIFYFQDRMLALWIETAYKASVLFCYLQPEHIKQKVVDFMIQHKV